MSAPPANAPGAGGPAAVAAGRRQVRPATRAAWRLVARLAVAAAVGLAAEVARDVLVPFPLASRLDPTAVGVLVCGLLLGPAGALGAAAVHLAVELGAGGRTEIAVLIAAAYALLGLLADSVFRLVPRLSRSLRDVRSYLGFLATAAVGSLLVAVLGSAGLFLRPGTTGVFLVGAVYWFGSCVTTLLIAGPLGVIVAGRLLAPTSLVVADLSAAEEDRGTAAVPAAVRREVLAGALMVVVVTAVVGPLVRMRPQFGGWIALLYLVPILWASSRRGLRGGVLAASASGVAFLVASALGDLVAPHALDHDQVMGQFAGLVIFALVGVVTGSFQQGRIRAEAELLRSNLELARRHESLQAVAELGDRLQRTLDEHAIAWETVATLVRLSRQPVVAAYLLEEDGATLRLVAHHGFTAAAVGAGTTLPVGGSLTGVAIRTLEPCSSDDLVSDPRLHPDVRQHLLADDLQAVISVPLVFEGRALGAVNLVYRDRDELLREDRDLLRTVGRTVALALVNARHVARLEHQAFHDPLTGLANREGYHRDFGTIAARTAGDGGGFAMVLVDVDRFKEVNDALGHHVGDSVLAALGRRILQALGDRPASVARLSGDAFAVLLPGITVDRAAQEAARGLLAAVSAPIAVDGMALQVEASAGVALYPSDAGSSAELLRCADVAVHRAKSTSQPVVAYAADLDLYAAERLGLASELGRAIRDGQLRVHFQPKVALADRGTVGFEALVRWEHPRLGLLPPSRFVPLAEVGELITPLTCWVLERAAAQLERWQRRRPGLTMAVNLSARNLLDGACASRVQEIVAAAGVDPTTIELELTETALLIDPDRASATLQRLSASGSRVVVDDFGTGYSSMTFLKRCPIHALKIDRSFVHDMRCDQHSRAIVRATVQLARDLDLAIVAEGVESEATAAALLEMGCDVGQGDLFCPALPSDELERRLGW